MSREETILDVLRRNAKGTTLADLQEDDVFVNAYELSGGNYDDAYDRGNDDGRTELARKILKLMGETP